MRNQIARLTLLAFGVHVLLGCCWHHAHAATTEAECIAAEHNHDSHSPVDHDHDRGQCPDCVGTCQYLPVARTQMDVSAALPMLAFVDHPTDAVMLLPAGQVDWLFAVIRYGPAPRLHLLHCLLLI